MSHSILPPSSAAVWSNCTGWVIMAACCPQLDSDASREGTAAHELAAKMIESASKANLNMPHRANTIGTVSSNGVVITDGIFESAEEYAADVIIVMGNMRVLGGPHFGIEQKVACGRVHADCFGTPDMFIYVAQLKTLYVWDFKNGHSIVEAFENKQMICYVSGIMDALGLSDLETRIVARIVQPRAYHREGTIREWTFMGHEIRSHINLLAIKAAEIMASGGDCQSGPHCKWCQARHACDTALTAGMGLFEMVGVPVPVELTASQLGTQLKIIQRALDQISYLESGYSQQVESLLRSGKSVPGYRLQESLGREKWTDAEAAQKAIGITISKPGYITPKQAITAGASKEIVKKYTEIPKTGLKVVPDDTNLARKVFSYEQ